MSDVTLKAGVSRIEITPPIGFRMQGAMRRIEPSVGIESPLLATALVIGDEKNKVVIFDCDLIGFDLPLADQIRVSVGKRLWCKNGDDGSMQQFAPLEELPPVGFPNTPWGR